MKPSDSAHIGTVRRRLLWLLLPPLILLLMAGVLLDYRMGAAPVREAYDQALADAALAVSSYIRIEPGTGVIHAELPDEAINLLRNGRDDDMFYAVFGNDSAYISGDRELLPATAGSRNPSFMDSTLHTRDVRLATYRTTTAAGLVTVVVAETKRKRDHATTRLLTGVVLTDLLQLGAIMLLVFIGVAAGLRPLLRLRDEIETRSPRELRALDETSVPGEVRPLVRALNQLFATVREAALAQQQFLANAAHQLRTPLAGLQAQLDLLAREAPSPGDKEKLLRLLDSCRRLAHTANQLLALARADPAANLPEQFQPVDLRRLIETCVTDQLDRALAKNIDLGVETVPTTIMGSAWLLRELLANLTDNALKYTPADGRITLRCDTDAQHRAFLEIEDDGPGIPASERAHVLQRFYRMPASSGDGCGLGLAIIDEITRLHQAELILSSGENDNGARIRVLFASAKKY
jgi:two-component system sensor histidine kinase TctE